MTGYVLSSKFLVEKLFTINLVRRIV